MYAHRTAAIRTKWIILILFGLGALALWSGSEAVLPAYIAGMVLAGSAARDAHWIRRLQDLDGRISYALLFSSSRDAGVVAGVVGGPHFVFVTLLVGKVLSKIFGLYPVVGLFRVIEMSGGITPS